MNYRPIKCAKIDFPVAYFPDMLANHLCSETFSRILITFGRLILHLLIILILHPLITLDISVLQRRDSMIVSHRYCYYRCLIIWIFQKCIAKWYWVAISDFEILWSECKRCLIVIIAFPVFKVVVKQWCTLYGCSFFKLLSL